MNQIDYACSVCYRSIMSTLPSLKWAGLEPKGEVQSDGGNGGVRIMINLGGEALGSAQLIDATPVDAE